MLNFWILVRRGSHCIYLCHERILGFVQIQNIIWRSDCLRLSGSSWNLFGYRMTSYLNTQFLSHHRKFWIVVACNCLCDRADKVYGMKMFMQEVPSSILGHVSWYIILKINNIFNRYSTNFYISGACGRLT